MLPSNRTTSLNKNKNGCSVLMSYFVFHYVCKTGLVASIVIVSRCLKFSMDYLIKKLIILWKLNSTLEMCRFFILYSVPLRLYVHTVFNQMKTQLFALLIEMRLGIAGVFYLRYIFTAFISMPFPVRLFHSTNEFAAM